LHNINDPNWNFGHENFYQQNRANCQACHGVDLTGTMLSKTATDASCSGRIGTT
jgi:hypothetical protein